jgi:uncharacterized protein with PIN domain
MKTITVALVFLATLSFTNTVDTKGREIAQKSIEADQGFQSESVELEMILTNRQGQVSKRYMTSQIFEMDDDGDKSMIEFIKKVMMISGYSYLLSVV